MLGILCWGSSEAIEGIKEGKEGVVAPSCPFGVVVLLRLWFVRDFPNFSPTSDRSKLVPLPVPRCTIRPTSTQPIRSDADVDQSYIFYFLSTYRPF